SKLIAPFTPFFAETMYQNLTGIKDGAGAHDPDQIGSKVGHRLSAGQYGTDGSAGASSSRESGAPALSRSIRESGAPALSRSVHSSASSVHLCDYPTADESLIDIDLAAEMNLVREIVSAGRAARTAAKLKVRQPLAQVEIILAKHEHESWLKSHAPLIAEELNVKAVEFATRADEYVNYQIKPNFKALGPKFGKQAPQIGKALQGIDAAAAREKLVSDGKFTFDLNGPPVELTSDEVEIRLEAKEGWSAAPFRGGVAVLSTEVSEELKREGLVRDFIHHVQARRKELDLAYEQRIGLQIAADETVTSTIHQFEDTIRSECLVDKIAFENNGDPEWVTVMLDHHALRFQVQLITES
ncbi:MAG: DUF5915 domain-containing protein, partial [Phycisphaerae bacterium]